MYNGEGATIKSSSGDDESEGPLKDGSRDGHCGSRILVLQAGGKDGIGERLED